MIILLYLYAIFLMLVLIIPEKMLYVLRRGMWNCRDICARIKGYDTMMEAFPPMQWWEIPLDANTYTPENIKPLAFVEWLRRIQVNSDNIYYKIFPFAH